MEHDDVVAALTLLAPGTELRGALDNILTAGNGALIVIGGDAAVAPLIDGGFRLDCPFSGPRLYELAKMDGAVVVSAGLSTILHANVQLQPDPTTPTGETGTRHRTAERLARQSGALVVAVSERRHTVTAYQGSWRYVLPHLGVLLARANQALQALAEHRRLLDRALGELNVLEFEEMVTRVDVVRALQRGLAVLRIGDAVRRHVVELGSEGQLVDMQANDLLRGVRSSVALVTRDYARKPDTELDAAEPEAAAIGHALGFGSDLIVSVYPRGYRILSLIPRLPASVIDRLVRRFGSLGALLTADAAALDEVEGVGAARAQVILQRLHQMRHDLALRRR